MTMRPGSFLWFQQPLTAADLVPPLYRQGLSIQRCVERLGDRFASETIAQAWAACHQSGGPRRVIRSVWLDPRGLPPGLPLVRVPRELIGAQGARP